jgi:hypothetical protein
MISIQLAGLNIQIDNHYPYTEQLCRDYIIDSNSTDISIHVSKEQIQAEQAWYREAYSPGYCESICIYREICKRILPFHAFLIHAAVVEMEGVAFAFTAKSGTGKSTHAGLWLKQFEGQARIINGDKPICRFHDDGELYIYGTPWCGKEGLQTNTSAPLKAIAFIERANKNQIHRISGNEVISRIFHQLLMPKDSGNMDAMLTLLDRMIERVPFFLLKCNPNQDAALVAYHGMTKFI